MSRPAIPPLRRTDFVRDLVGVYRRLCEPGTTEPAETLSALYADLIQHARAVGCDPIGTFMNALVAAAPDGDRPWKAPEYRTYHSMLVAPVDGVTDRSRRDETTDLEVVIMRHDELMTRTAHRRVVTGRRGDADLYHDHDLLPPGPVADTALQLWEERD